MGKFTVYGNGKKKLFFFFISCRTLCFPCFLVQTCLQKLVSELKIILDTMQSLLRKAWRPNLYSHLVKHDTLVKINFKSFQKNRRNYHLTVAVTQILWSTGFRLHGLRLPTGNNSLWFYSIQGVFRVAFELYSQHEQLSVLEAFQVLPLLTLVVDWYGFFKGQYWYVRVMWLKTDACLILDIDNHI